MAALDTSEKQAVQQLANLWVSMYEFGITLQRIQARIGTDYSEVLTIPRLVAGMQRKKARIDALNIPIQRVRDIFGDAVVLADIVALFDAMTSFQTLIKNSPTAFPPSWSAENAIQYTEASPQVQAALAAQCSTLLAFYV